MNKTGFINKVCDLYPPKNLNAVFKAYTDILPDNVDYDRAWKAFLTEYDGKYKEPSTAWLSKFIKKFSLASFGKYPPAHECAKKFTVKSRLGVYEFYGNQSMAQAEFEYKFNKNEEKKEVEK